MSDQELPKWKSFEESAAHASSKIYANEIVQPNQKVMGEISEVLRQIDIKVGENEFIDIECKDHGAPVDLPIMEQFAHKLKDEKAKSGIMISNSGFTASALRTAKHYGIKPVALIDKGFGDKSKFFLRAPVRAVGFYVDAISYGVASRGVGQDFHFSPLIWDMKVGDDSGRNVYEFFRDAWANDELEISAPGSYQYQFDRFPVIDLKGKTYWVEMTFRYIVKADARDGHAGAKSARGFYDVNEGSFISNETVEFEPIEVEKIAEWPEAQDAVDDDQPLRLMGIIPLPDEPPLSAYENPFTGKQLDPAKVEKGVYL